MADPRVDELWRDVLTRWSDEAPHRAFVEYCRVTKQLAEAAARYRATADAAEPPYRDAGTVDEARKRLAAIAVLAMAELEAQRTELGDAQQRIRRAIRFAFVIAALLIVALSGILAMRVSSSSVHPAPADRVGP